MFHLIRLDKRISGKLPEIEIVNMESEAKKHNYIISSKLDLEINKALSKNEQVMILINRRGYSNYIICANKCQYLYLKHE